MSIDAIRKSLTMATHSDNREVVRLAQEALAEWERVEKACRTLDAEGIEDGVYDVRGRAAADASFTGNTWEHPRVVAYGEAAQLITKIAKESAT